jgi:hypothetical protein
MPAKVRRVLAALGVLDSGPLAGFGGFGLCLCGRGHEANERIPDSLLHRVLGSAVEREVVDDRADAGLGFGERSSLLRELEFNVYSIFTRPENDKVVWLRIF